MHEVTYTLEDGTEVCFEVESPPGFRPATPAATVAGSVSEAVQPAVGAAREVLRHLKETKVAEVSVSFGVKVAGGARWMVASAAAEASFTVTMTWRSPQDA